MLKPVLHWLFFAGIVADAALLLRILGLRLQQVYLFLTLDAVLSLLFDAADYWLGWDSAESLQVFLLSRYLYALVLPAIVWEVFEEVKKDIAPARRIAGLRLISSILTIAIFTFIFTMMASDGEDNGKALSGLIGLVLWTATCFGSVFFLRTIWQAMKAPQKQGNQKRLPRNTVTWYWYYLLTLIGSLINTAVFALFPKATDTESFVVQVFFGTFGISCTVWCLTRLRSLPLNSQTVPAEH